MVPEIYLVLNVGNTKEMVIDFRGNIPNYKTIMVKGEAVEQVDKIIPLFRLSCRQQT